MGLFAPQGGWCITSRSNTAGLSALPLYFGPTTLVEFLTLSIAGAIGRTTASVESAIKQALSDMAPTLPMSANEGAELLWAMWKPTSQIVQTLNYNLAAVGTKLHTITGNRLPQLLRQANVHTTAAINVTAHQLQLNINAQTNAVLGQEQADVHQLQLNINAQTNAVTATSLHRANTVADYADTLAHDLATYTETETTKIRQDLTATQRWADTQIRQTRVQAATDAANAANTATKNENHTVHVTLTKVWAGTAESANRTGSEVSKLAPTLAPTLTKVPTEVPLGIAPALLGLTNGLRSVSTAVDECALPNCATKNRNARQQHQLGTVVMTGAFLAFLAEVMRTPPKLVDEAATTVETITSPIVDAVKAFIG